MKIKELAFQERPRERLKIDGPSSLSTAELLAIILQQGTKEWNVLELSQKVLSSFSLKKLKSATFHEVTRIPGIGDVKASQLLSLFELCKRVNSLPKQYFEVRGPKDVYELFKDEMKDKDKEHFYTIMLDTKNKIIDTQLVSIGTLNKSIIHPREVFSAAIKNSANSIIIVHNHPSGDPNPSGDDVKATNVLEDVSKIVGIKLLDHIIVGEKEFWNYKNSNIETTKK